MKWFPLFSILFLNACSNLPANIKNPPTVDIQLHQALANAANYQNYPVRWGGTIIEVKNKTDETTMQILYYPLNYYGRPKLNQTSPGRFITVSKQYLDPAIYSKGAEITIAGALQRLVEQQVGENSVKMPLVAIDTQHTWPKYRKNNYSNYYDYPYRDYGYRDRYYPYNYYRTGFSYYKCY